MIAKILPADARAVLIRASQTLPRSQRPHAIDTAIAHVRALYPQLFKEEKNESETE